MASNNRIQTLAAHVLQPGPSKSSGASEMGRQRYGDAEWELRCKLAMAYRVSNHYGWDQLVFNHITAKVPGSEKLKGGPHFLINPFGLRFDEVTASSLLKVDIDANIVDSGTNTGPLFKQGFVVHSSVHAVRKDCHIVWHNHHFDTTACSITKFGLLPLSQEAIVLLRQDVKYHPFEGSATDLNERERIAKSLGPTSKVLILLNHGPVTAGETVEEAFFYMYLVTLASTWQARALAAVGGDLSKMNIPDDELLKAASERLKFEDLGKDSSATYNEAEAAWNGIARLMESKFGAENIYC
mmetsp:Transcript_15177/g.23194  ORF Transcript_15177/g.23194 Transcript_15177/m.23194 type:complete len:298 (-) Transcript_15177:561-1454(-)